MAAEGGRTVWKFCVRVPLSDDEDNNEADRMENPLRDPNAAVAAAPPAPVRPEKKKESKKTKKSGNTGGSGSGIDVQYTNTGAMDIVFASDSDTGKCWIKDVQSSRLKPGMRLVSMDVLDTETQKMVTRELDGVPFTEVVKELEAQTSIGQQGISAYHMKFEPDLESAAVTGLSLSRLVRMESKHDKEVIDALEAIDRGTERSAGLAIYKSEEHEKQKAKLAMAEANQKKLQKRVQNLERERETTEQQHEDQLRRVTVLEREEAAAVEECRAQLREMEDSLAKVNQDLKSMQAKNEDLGNDFATQSGQLEAARKREVQAHEAQAQLAKQLMDSMDQVKDDEAAIQKVKSQSAERGVQAFQLTNEIETLKSQKEADDKEIELKTVQLREATAATRQAGQREETARNELGTKIEQLEAVIAKLNAKSDRQQENQKLERATAAATVAAMEEERKQLQSTVEEWETKHSSLRAQYTEMQTTMALATKEIGGLKQQREDIQTKLAEQLKEQEIERAKVEKEEAALQRKVDQEAAELEKQQKLAARDLRLAEDADKFHENQMATSITDKIRQITALKKQVKQLQEQLQLEKQARTEHELEVERLNKDVVSEAKDIEDLKVELATLKTTVESKNEQITKAAAEKAQSEANVEDLKGQMQTQADNQQAQLDGEISRANESEAMRAQVEAKLKGVTQELLEVRRNFDDLNGQHNTTIAQIATLERRSKMQNAAAKTVSALAQSSLTEVTQAHSVDVVEIQKLKDDYTQLHGLLDKSLRDLAQAREELENHQKQLGELNQEKADVTSANEKTISELQASLATAQAFEKQEVAKLAAMGQELTRMTTQHGKEALAARAASGKVTELTASVSQKDAELNKARGRISELETVQQQVNTDVQTYLQQLQGLSEELKSEKRIRKECEAQLKETTSELMAEKGLSEVAQTELAQTKTQLSTALAVQPVLDDTKRQLEATAAELENTKTTMAAEHAQTRDSLTAELEETKKVMAAEHARTKDSVTAELEETKTTLTAELEQTKAALATAQGDIKDLQASKRMLAADLAADEKALAGDDDKIATQSSQIKALSGQITELEASLAKESAARAADAKAAAAAKKAAAEAAKAEAVKAAEAAESAKVAAKKQADATLAETKKAAEAAKVAAKKQADSQAIALQREAQKLSQEVAAARSATADAENTITSRDAELKAQAETAAAEAKSLRQSVAGAQAETKQTTADCEKKVSMAEKATSDVHAKLNASESEHAITKGLLQAETEAKKSVQQQADEIAEKLAHEVKSHNETQDMTRSQLDDAKLTIDRYAKETAADKAERDGLQDKLKDMERERMRIYGRLAETQMVLLSKNKALTESAMQAKRYRAMSTLKVSLMQSAKTRLQESAEENTEKLHEEVRQAEAEAMKIAGEAAAQLEADRAKTDAELTKANEELSKAQRQVEDQESRIQTMLTTITGNRASIEELEKKTKELDNQCSLWRAKVRHRHRALEMPEFAKSKKGQKEKEEWLKQKALDDSLGFDDTLNQDVTVVFDGTSEYEKEHNNSLGLGLLNCKDREKVTHTLIHSMAEGSTSDKCPQLVNGQVLVSINGDTLEGMNVAEVCEKLKTASRPVSLVCRPGSMELKLVAYQDHKHDTKGKKGKKGKKK